MTEPTDERHTDNARNGEPGNTAAPARPDELGEAEEAVRRAEKEAQEAVEQAEEELARARELYRRVRGRATERLKRLRQTTAGDLVDGTLKLVKEYPGPSVIVAMLIGFFLGRSSRR